MKTKMYMYIFLIMNILLFLGSGLFTEFSFIVKTFIISFVLYYFMKTKVSEDKKKLIIYLYFLIFSFLIYSLFMKDRTDMISFVYIPISFLFINYYYMENNLIKINVVNILKLLGLLISFFSIFGFVSDSFSYILILTLPLFVKNYEKDVNVFDISFTFLNLFAIFSFKNRVLNILAIIYLVIVLIFGFINLKEKGSKIVIIVPEIYLIFSVFLINFYPPFLHYVDSSFFENEYLFIKVIKSLLVIIPFIYFLINPIKSVYKNYRKVNIKYFSYIYILFEVIAILFICKFDVNFFLLIICSFMFILSSKYLEYLSDDYSEDVTIFALHLGYGGIEKYISSLCKMLKEKYKVNIISTYKTVDNPAFDFKDVNIKYIMNYGPNKSEFLNARESGNFKSIIKEGIKSLCILYNKRFLNIEEIEKVNSKYIITTRDFHNYLVGANAKDGIIKIATEHNHHNNDFKYVSKVVHSVKNSDYFVLVSDELKKFYEKRTKCKCVYIPNVLDKSPNKKAKCLNHTLISVGRLSYEKGQKDLIDVLSLVKKEINDIKLYLIGDGEDLSFLKEYASLKKVSKNIIFTGFLGYDEIQSKMLDSSVYVTTSFTESFGLSVLEACSFALPVVAFDTAQGVKALLKDGSGILISNRSLDDMKDEIIKLLTNKKYSKEIREKGYNMSLNYLSSNVKDKWFKLVK